MKSFLRIKHSLSIITLLAGDKCASMQMVDCIQRDVWRLDMPGRIKRRLCSVVPLASFVFSRV